ncbi:MAG: transporter substrate-binding domain-containing protein [Anaerolineales bacterium]|nr:transporter substrate-binding domain-containing protein [Anaerolineales bacterium]
MKKLFPRIFPVLVIMSLILISCSATDILTESAAIPASTVMPAASATSGALESDPVWDRIVANKKIVVGTSWDYPPFASIDPNFHAAGFDIALIEEIGRRLNIPVEVQNFSFDGLSDALNLNQIDLAVAAISITPERVSQISFSTVYYVNQTAVLAKNGSQVPTITDLKQLTRYRVGVQRGTTYQSMIQSALVDTKLMSADKLLSYTKADEAVRDLIANRVDVVVVGQATASYYGARHDLRVAGQGFDQQDLAVAMRLGTPRLKAEIDRVMGEMLTDGTILSFIQQYIQSDLAGILSTPIPASRPTATALPPIPTATPPACVDGMKFVSDITINDDNMKNPPFFKPGAGFVKTWRVENTGTCTWTPNYRFVYAYGNVAAAQMGGQPLSIPVNVAPGEVIDLSVTLIAPTDPLTYQGFWQIENDKGRRFGQTVWVAITTLEDQDNPVEIGQPSGNYCVVTKVLPTDAIKVRENFDAVWTVRNISGQEWRTDTVDYKFISGTKMHEKSSYDLTQTIKDGESANIIVDMNAPDQPGFYSTNWAIVAGNKTLCILTITVRVIAK